MHPFFPKGKKQKKMERDFPRVGSLLTRPPQPGLAQAGAGTQNSHTPGDSR